MSLMKIEELKEYVPYCSYRFKEYVPYYSYRFKEYVLYDRFKEIVEEKNKF